ncbi:NRDE-2, necessary for RNA interference-domain-containing protein [Ephemerocybe angulata]|uniref:NRDE-2, necessary for RNA interference-domain-containing protein n=1 Tax=Ephemerocybe angulata TaxID=980116 RepID=A0A8H6MF72_9AGAR|nr:NRDE-2, necessary for RNA interference-domain-containing protein [Tulosesus angulatus]
MSIPSFTSFPTFEPEYPKQSSTSESRLEKRKRDESHKSSASSKRKDRDRDRGRETSRERHREKDKDRHKKRDKDKHKERSRKLRGDDSRDQRLEDVPSNVDETYRMFFSDRKPDRLNIQYGSIHAGDIPKYRLIYGGRYAIGLPRGLTLYRAGKGVEVCVKSRNNKLSSITDSRTRSLLALPPNRRVIQSDENGKYTEVDGFIRLPTRRGKSSPEDTYRSILEANPGDSTGSESDSSAGSSDEGGSDDEVGGDKLPETSQQAQLRTLEERLAEDKGEVGTWLELLDATLSSIPITSKNATKARCDITVALLERAIKSHSTCNASPILRIKYLKAGEEVWSPAQLKEQWEAALGLGDVALWLEWLEWRMRHRRDGLDGLVEDVTRLLSSPPFQGETADVELARIRAFWRTLVAIQSAGFAERAMAMLQAQLEVAFHLPSALETSPFSYQMDELEEFWEGESLRTLEDGAKGWDRWFDNFRPDSDATAVSPQKPLEIRDLDPYRQWAFQEAAEDVISSFPSRAPPEAEGVDPYSMVLFSDIRPLLVPLTTPQAKQALRLLTLTFLGIPLPGLSQVFSGHAGDANWDDRWSMGSARRIASIVPNDTERRDIVGESIAGAIIANEKEYRDAFGPIKQWGYGALSPLDIWMKGTKARTFFWDSGDIEGVDTKLVLRAFSQLRQGEGDFEWDLLALAFEAALNVKSSLKLSKAFLSVPRHALEYWNAHAQLERINGRPDAARKVYQTVLADTQSPSPQAGVSAMWWSWAEMEWLSGKGDQAMCVVLRSVGVESTTGVGVLRAKRALSDAAAMAAGWRDKQNWTKLRALFELLNGVDMAEVLTIFDAQLASLQHGEVAHESLTMASLLFVYNYRVVIKAPMPPVLLRERAEHALEEYPSNSIILGVFLEGEKGQGVWGKVRGMLRASNGKVKDVARRVEEVWVAGWEKGRWPEEIERTRSGLAAAVEHERTRGKFEIKARQHRTAKKLLFRAIGECPLVKELYLLAFGPLRALRLHRGLDEVVDIVAENKEAVDNEEDEDEIEHNARELRRLMPY